MSTDEKIGQLFMIAGYVDPEFAKSEIGNAQIMQDIDRYITDFHVGGIAYVGPSDSKSQVTLTNHYQRLSKYPILIAQDLEWGLSMRLQDGMRFPKNITLGAVDDNTLIYAMGQEIGRQAKLIGVHMNLSPVLDVNIEPENIVINVRSFGDCPRKVAEKGVAMIRGLQDAGIIASAKHFPGLGDITTDPHLGLPASHHNQQRLQAVELYPFVQAVAAGVLSIQTEHLLVPAFDPNSKSPASLSSKVVNDLLKKEMGFTGLVISGALRMKALTDHYSAEDITLKAFQAGSDMLLMPADFPRAYQILKDALSSGKISEREIDQRVLKILRLKEYVNLHRERIVPIPSTDTLKPVSAKNLKAALYQQAVTVKRDGAHLVPIANHQKIAYVQLGEAASNECVDRLRASRKVDRFETNGDDPQTLSNKLQDYSLILLAVHPLDSRRIAEIRLLQDKQQQEALKNFRVHGIPEPWVQLINELERHQVKTIVTYFGNPFGLHFFDRYSTLLMAYEDDSEAQRIAAKRLLNQ